MRTWSFIAVATPLLLAALNANARELAPKEKVRFYPSVGHAADGSLLLQGRVYLEVNRDGKRWRLFSKIARWIDGKEPHGDGGLAERGEQFFEEDVDEVEISLRGPGDTEWMVTTDDEGYFETWVTVPSFAGSERWIDFSARAADGREFPGQAWLLGEAGRSVISDIDDTVKITEVTNRREMVKNTFSRSFRAVPGMSSLYRELLSKSGSLHFLSSSPRQLFVPLQRFLAKENFPPASIHLRFFHFDENKPNPLYGSASEEFKVTAIRDLLRRFPKRKFLLVGDSGEKDPEIYSRIVREFPAQVSGVWIRNVSHEDRMSARYRGLFSGKSRNFLKVFQNPEDLKP